MTERNSTLVGIMATMAIICEEFKNFGKIGREMQIRRVDIKMVFVLGIEKNYPVYYVT